MERLSSASFSFEFFDRDMASGNSPQLRIVNLQKPLAIRGLHEILPIISEMFLSKVIGFSGHGERKLIRAGQYRC